MELHYCKVLYFLKIFNREITMQYYKTIQLAQEKVGKN